MRPKSEFRTLVNLAFRSLFTISKDFANTYDDREQSEVVFLRLVMALLFQIYRLRFSDAPTSDMRLPHYSTKMVVIFQEDFNDFVIEFNEIKEQRLAESIESAMIELRANRYINNITDRMYLLMTSSETAAQN